MGVTDVQATSSGAANACCRICRSTPLAPRRRRGISGGTEVRERPDQTAARKGITFCRARNVIPAVMESWLDWETVLKHGPLPREKSHWMNWCPNWLQPTVLMFIAALFGGFQHLDIDLCFSYRM